MRSGEISADLRSARRSAISASASPAPLKSKVPVGLVGLGEIGEGKREEGRGRERDGEERLRGRAPEQKRSNFSDFMKPSQKRNRGSDRESRLDQKGMRGVRPVHARGLLYVYRKMDIT